MRKIQFTRPVSPYLNGEAASFDEATAEAHVRAGRAVYVGGPLPKLPPQPLIGGVPSGSVVTVEAPAVEVQAAVSETPADKMLTTGRAGRPRR